MYTDMWGFFQPCSHHCIHPLTRECFDIVFINQVYRAIQVILYHDYHFVNRVREIASFELGKEIEKGVFHLVMNVGQRKILSPYEELNLRPLDFNLRCSTTEPQRLYSE